jgi:uncharacterized protein (DUF2235 family)
MTDTGENAVRAKATKRIILLLDGTWNDMDFGDADTNIVRLQEIITGSLADRERRHRNQPLNPAKVATSYGDPDGPENIVFYERGVGTGWRDRFKGGIFGVGLDDKVRNAYRFLAYHYEEGAQVFVFGFSRGSYTARSLIGWIASAGLLRRETCTEENEWAAWRYYRTPPAQRLSGAWTALGDIVHPRSKVEIACVGVFDTVGALGIPLSRFSQFNRDQYEFHDVELSSITRLNLHAIALDEHRRPFEASPWRKPKFKRFTSFTEQVWFSGVHSDIGGGYVPAVDRRSSAKQALDDITLDWMLKNVKARYPDFPVDHYQSYPGNEDRWPTTGPGWEMAAQHESRRHVYRLMPLTLRSVGNYPLSTLSWRQYNGCYNRHAVSMWEKVHISAIARLGQTVSMAGKNRRYLPINLIAALPTIRATYHDQQVPARTNAEIRVVDWSGKQFDPNNPNDCAAVLQLVAQAAGQLK